MKKSVFFLLVGVVSSVYALQTNLVVQQVGVMVRTSPGLESVGLFLGEEIIGKSERQRLRLVSARQDDLSLLKIDRLSAVVILSLFQTNQRIVVDVGYVDSGGTNEFPMFATFSATNWMRELPEVSVRIHAELLRRYPPKQVSEIRTVEVRRDYASFANRENEGVLVGAIGYSGRRVKGYSKWYNAGTTSFRDTLKVISGGAFDVFGFLRYGMWRTEIHFHGFFAHGNTLLLEPQVGYDFFGGMVSPLGGVLLSYDEHFWSITNTGGENKVFEFSTVRVLPLLGVRVAFQPSFWFTVVGGGLPSSVSHTLWAERKPETFVLDSMFIRVQTYVRYGRNWLVFLSWKMWNSVLPWREEGYFSGDPNWWVQSFEEILGSVTIGGAYVF
ncbi:MAG: hypothetical protein N2314_00130 [Brevinematales bacterium]|nr:hypothetical protein [Brevinematales bacterium]